MKKELLEHFFNAKDEIRILDRHLKIWIGYLLAFPIVLTILWLLKRIDLWMILVPWISFFLMIVIFLFIHSMSDKEVKFYWKAGMELVLFSFLCFYVSAVFSYTENYNAFTYYLSFWLIESIVVVLGILYNIKRDAYVNEPVFKDIPFRFSMFTAIILIIGIVFNLLPIFWAYFFPLDSKFSIFSRSSILLAWPFNFLGLWTLLGWRLMLKGLLLKKYTILKDK